MTTFGTWTHPATGATRVYIAGFGQTKVWAEQCAKDAFGFEYTIRAVNTNKNQSELGNIVNEAERAIFQTAGARVQSFEAVLALVK